MAVNKRLRIVYTGGAQLRAAYDGSNYSDFTTNSSGGLTIAPSGGNTTVTGSLAVSSFLTLSSYVDQTRASAGGISFQSKATGDAAQRYTQTIAGTQQWGNGTDAPDVTLARAGVGLLQLTGRLLIGTSAAGSATAGGAHFTGVVQADAHAYFGGAISGGLANRLALANNGSGQSQVWALGPDTSTAGSVAFVVARSDLSSSITWLSVNTSGHLIPNLPTSSAGLTTGTLWNDSGTVKVA